MTTPVWIGLGSNLGDRKATLDAAVAALAEALGVVVRAVSSYHETAPVGGPPGQGSFLNAAARLDTTLDPHQLLAVTQAVENRLGPGPGGPLGRADARPGPPDLRHKVP